MGFDERPTQIERLPEEEKVAIDPTQQHDDYAPNDVQKEVRMLDDPEWIRMQKKYLRKLDWILMPTISLLYFFEYLDRGNIANAKLYGYSAGHETKTHGIGPGKHSLTDKQWQTVIMIFYVGLILCQVPGCIGYRVFPPSKWIAFGVCGWNATSLLQCVAFNYPGALVCRIFLGAFEGLFGTGIVYFLSLWYHRTEMGVRVFWFLGPTALAGAFGGLIAYGIGHLDSPTPTWKWLFLIEALPSFCLGLFCLYWVPDRPMKNSRFSGTDQEIAEARFHSESFEKAGKFKGKHMLAAVTDWRLYGQVAVYLPTAAMLSSISGFLPSVIRDLGYNKPTTANLMTVPPYACAFVLMYVMSVSSDHFRERGLHITALAVVATIAYALLATLPDTALHGKYGCICVSVACVYATYPPSHAWAANNFGNETKRAVGMGVYTALGNFGSIAGSFFYPSSDGPQFRKGHHLSMGMAIATAVFAFSNSMALRYVNRQKDKKYGKPAEGVPVNVSELADAAPHFRYIT